MNQEPLPTNMLVFCTFGGGQLTEFDIAPMSIMLYIPDADDEQLRAILRTHPLINNKYCTTYPASHATKFIDKYDMYPMTLEELQGLAK